MANVLLALTLLAVANASVIRKLTPAQVERLANWREGDKQNIWELSGQFEGDMILSDKQRNVISDESFRWPNKTVPYEFATSVSKDQRQFIELVFKVLEMISCVKIKPRTEEVDYVYITNEFSGCWSQVGRQGSKQQLNLQPHVLGYGCFRMGAILHEVLHTLGFVHQHNSYERDDYIDIIWENIDERELDNFKKYSSETVTNFGEKYDYASIMHYSEYAATANGLKTIIPKDPKAQIGLENLSPIDINKLRKMYEC